jgi:hypothetical protein
MIVGNLARALGRAWHSAVKKRPAAPSQCAALFSPKVELRSPNRLCLAALATLISFAAVPSISNACVEISALTLRQAFLNHLYPNALYVYGATWELQQKGVLPMPDRQRITAIGAERAAIDTRVKLEMFEALSALRIALDAARIRPHAVSLVLVERMHWVRYRTEGAIASLLGEYSSFEGEATGPGDGDLVVVTNEVVLRAMRAGDITIDRARELGVFRLYGTDARISTFIEDFGNIGGGRLPTPDPSQLVAGCQGEGLQLTAAGVAQIVELEKTE